MAKAFVGWWSTLSDLQKAMSLVGTFASSIVAAILAFALAWSNFSGFPERMQAVEETASENASALQEVGRTLHDIQEAQGRQTCILLAEANGTNPLECVR